ncbi:GIY-YIG nuclease family protein [Anaerococcus cruorum]|uniref:GIY-YIG nuclease family protein n=1 Tax=Anaerococcus sp. WGS1529 TaxID=3366812 RepID=UPI00372D0322
MINFSSEVKIGCSSKPEGRIKKVTSYLKNYAGLEAEDIFVSPSHVNYRENENLMHKKFEYERLEGTELFSINYPLVVETLSSLEMDCDL